jgi:ATP phosphoribosyltransferase regulatory subunit HisZ
VDPVPNPRVIVAPEDDDAGLAKAVEELRAKGEAVVVALPGETHEDAKRLVRSDGSWHLE